MENLAAELKEMIIKNEYFKNPKSPLIAELTPLILDYLSLDDDLESATEAARLTFEIEEVAYKYA